MRPLKLAPTKGVNIVKEDLLPDEESRATGSLARVPSFNSCDILATSAPQLDMLQHYIQYYQGSTGI